jgi:hypothetical protein
MSNSQVAGYVTNGFFNSVVDKITFSNDSKSTLAAGLSSSKNGPTGFANSGTL